MLEPAGVASDRERLLAVTAAERGGDGCLEAREPDGAETGHFEAFARLLGAKRGRFLVSGLDDEPKLALPGTMAELLAAACQWWRPLALKVDRKLCSISSVTLDPRRSSEFGRRTSKPMRQVVKRLSGGEVPAKIVRDMGDDALVATTLRELARRLAVVSLPVDDCEAENSGEDS